MKRASPWLAVIFFLGCVVLGWWVLDLRSELARAASARDEAATVSHRQIVDLKHQLVQTRATAASAAKQIAQLQQTAGAGPAAGTRSDMKVIHLSDVLRDHPEYAALQAMDARRNVERTYGVAIDRLNLTPEQRAKLKALLVERQMSSTDAMVAAQAAGIERGTPAWQEAMKQSSQDVEQGISTLLGPGGQATWQQLQQRTSFENQVSNNFSPDFAAAGVALSADQNAGLVQAMADASYVGKDESGRPQNYNEPDPTTGITPHQQRVLDAAAQVLTPAQFQIFKADQLAQIQQQAIFKQYTQGASGYMIVP